VTKGVIEYSLLEIQELKRGEMKAFEEEIKWQN
jgi:hypothetical protein